MRQRWFFSLSMTTLTALFGAFVASPVLGGEPSPPTVPESYVPNARHLLCYKVKDRTRFRGTTIEALTLQLTKSQNCQVKRAQEVCVPAQKTIKTAGTVTVDKTELSPEDFGGSGCPGDYICAKIKCDKIEAAEQAVLDQFGVRNVALKKPFKVCMPAMKGCQEPGRVWVNSCTNLYSERGLCDKAWQISDGTRVPTACFYGQNANGSTGCYGCGPNNEKAGVCDNSCINWSICGDREYVRYCEDLADPNSETTCNSSWQAIDGVGPVSCYYGPDVGDGASECRRCSREREVAGLCTDACPLACVGRGYIAGPSGPSGSVRPSWTYDPND